METHTHPKSLWLSSCENIKCLFRFQILNLTQSATEKEINDRHKEFVRKSHPDRFPNVDGEEKKKIEDRFIEIQQAFERVSKIKAKRMRKNKISDEL